MAGHSFAGSSWTPSADRWKSIPGLEGKCETPEAVIPCTHGCGYNMIPALSIWVDFGRKILQTDTSRVDCDRAPARASASTTPSAGTPAVRHVRPDIAKVVPAVGLRTPIGPRPDIIQFDDRFMAAAKDEQKQRAITAHTFAPPNLRQVERRFVRQGLDVVGTLVNALYLESIASSAIGRHTVSIQRAVKGETNIKGEARHITVSDLLVNLISIIFVLRGIVERVDHLATVQGTIFPTVKHHEFLNQMMLSMADEFAIVKDCLEKPERFWAANLVQHVEGLSVFALGAGVFSHDASAVRAFFRTEVAREEAAAKKLGWKPSAVVAASSSAVDASPAATAAGAAAQPSPVRQQQQQQKKGDKRDKPPTKKRRRGRSGSVKAGAGTGTDGTSP